MSNGVPVPPNPVEDADLDAVFQFAVAGITGLDGTMVRPRWQPTLPQQPEPDEDWCAIGVMASIPDAFPYITHFSGQGITDPSADTFWRHEELDVLASFYGPNAKKLASRLRDGLSVVQNTETLLANQIAFIESSPMRASPDFVNQQWIRKYDLPLRFRRKVQRVYAMPNILSAQVDLFDDTGHVDRIINVPQS
jgi:hypothetical protein